MSVPFSSSFIHLHVVSTSAKPRRWTKEALTATMPTAPFSCIILSPHYVLHTVALLSMKATTCAHEYPTSKRST
jgi:hypothetical protein